VRNERTRLSPRTTWTRFARFVGGAFVVTCDFITEGALVDDVGAGLHGGDGSGESVFRVGNIDDFASGGAELGEMFRLVRDASGLEDFICFALWVSFGNTWAFQVKSVHPRDVLRLHEFDQVGGGED
jgi:hypothetical protein